MLVHSILGSCHSFSKVNLNGYIKIAELIYITNQNRNFYRNAIKYKYFLISIDYN